MYNTTISTSCQHRYVSTGIPCTCHGSIEELPGAKWKSRGETRQLDMIIACKISRIYFSKKRDQASSPTFALSSKEISLLVPVLNSSETEYWGLEDEMFWMKFPHFSPSFSRHLAVNRLKSNFAHLQRSTSTSTEVFHEFLTYSTWLGSSNGISLSLIMKTKLIYIQRQRRGVDSLCPLSLRCVCV